MQYRLAAAAAALMFLAGCVTITKEADSAAATGDWKTAYVRYQAALEAKPDAKEVKQKLENARGRALQQSRAKAQLCLQQRDWSCVRGESQFILTAEPGAPDAVQLDAQASMSEALDVLESARATAAQRRFREALEATSRASTLSSAPEVAAKRLDVNREIALAAIAEADRLRPDRKYAEALEAMKVAAQCDPAHANRLRQVEAERDQWVSYQYEAATYEGDQLMDRRDWAAARDRYRAAIAIRSGGRAEGLARYSDAMARGTAALSSHSYPSAEAAFKEAVATSLDRGEARRAISRLKVRPFRIALLSLLLMPARPDGNPWVGPKSPAFSSFASQVQEHLANHAYERAVELALTVPNENWPKVRLEVALPDGTQLTTRPGTGLFITYQGELVVSAFGYDDQRLIFRVMQRSAGGSDSEIGRTEVTLGELSEDGDVFLGSETVGQLHVTAVAPEGAAVGSVSGLSKLEVAPAAASPGSHPPAASPPPPPPVAPHTVTVARPLPPPPETPLAARGSPPQPPPVGPPMAPSALTTADTPPAPATAVSPATDDRPRGKSKAKTKGKGHSHRKGHGRDEG
jgi:hypothetical protein